MVQSNLPDALIGKTGFVGAHLASQHNFVAQFNRSNVNDAAGQSFSTLVCAAAPGSMFVANRDPDADAAAVDALISAVSGIHARRVVLVSTIAVLARFDGKDSEGTSNFQTETPYGLNRRRLEAFCADRFQNCLIVRLPALFGRGLRKNFIFDILNPIPAMLTRDCLTQILDILSDPLGAAMRGLYDLDAERGLYVVDRGRITTLPERAELEAALIDSGLSARDFTNLESTFQYYDLRLLWDDITRGLTAGLTVLHIAPEPLRAGDVHLALTGHEMAVNSAPLHHENMHTRYSALWGRTGSYSSSADQVLAGLHWFYTLQGGQRDTL